MDATTFPDERLELVFTCCHPALATEAQVALTIVDTLDLDEYHYLHSTRAELLRRLGRAGEAGDAYRRALELVHDEAERRLLERRVAELDARCPD
jgi:predicted RNA polymerase sigma factor